MKETTMRKTNYMLAVLTAALAFLLAPFLADEGQAQSRSQTLAITNGRIITVSGPVIPRGTVVVRDGKIAAVGANVSVPSGARVIDARGANVYPGLIDPLTTLGLTEIPTVAGSVDTSEIGTYTPAVDTSWAVHPHSEIIPTVRVNGITTVLAAPRGGTIAGQAALINLDGWTPQEITLVRGAALYAQIPHWSSVSAQAAGAQGTGPAARLARERYARQQLDDLRRYIALARAYGAAKKAAAGSNPVSLTPDVDLEAMLPFLDGGRPWIVPATTDEQIRQVIAFARQQRIRVVIAGAADAWKVATQLAEANVPVLINPQAQPRGRDEAYDVGFTNALVLQKAGVKFAFTSNSAADARNLHFSAALAVGFGLPADYAVRALTLSPAEILGVADQVGSIEVGKVANLVVARGDILDIRTPIQAVIIGGRQIELRSRHTDLYDKFKVR